MVDEAMIAMKHLSLLLVPIGIAALLLPAEFPVWLALASGVVLTIAALAIVMYATSTK